MTTSVRDERIDIFDGSLVPKCRHDIRHVPIHRSIPTMSDGELLWNIIEGDSITFIRSMVYDYTTFYYDDGREFHAADWDLVVARADQKDGATPLDLARRMALASDLFDEQGDSRLRRLRDDGHLSDERCPKLLAFMARRHITSLTRFMFIVPGTFYDPLGNPIAFYATGEGD